MSRLIDATICPDCRGGLDPGATCTACGLQVKGPLAVQLWNVMVTADQLVEQLRGAAVTQPAPESVSGGTREHSQLASGPAPMVPPAARPRRLPAASVPVVLLSLGGLCLLVAAVVFVAVTWNLLGLTGRTLVLLGFTSVLAVVAVSLTRRGLRVAAETFWVVVGGMLAVDLLGAQSAGLAGLDSLDWRGTGALVGGALLALGTGVGSWARRQSVDRLYGAEAVAAVGGVVVCSTNAWFAADPAIACTVAVPLLAGCSAVLRRLVPLAAYALGGLAAATWLALLLVGWGRALETAAPAAWWADLRGWPLIAAAAIGAATVHLLPETLGRSRSVLAGLTLVPIVLLVNGPATDATPTRDLMIACATLVGLGLVTAYAPKVWALGASALTALGIFFIGLWLAFGPWNVLSTLDTDGHADLHATMLAQDDTAASWTSLVAALTLVVSAVCLLRHLPPAQRDAARAVGTLAPAVLALGGLDLVLELEPPLWAAVLAAVLATAVAGGASWWSRDHLLSASLGSLATAYLALVTLYAALAVDLLAALTATVLFVSLAAVSALRDRVGAQLSAAMAAALCALVGGGALVAWGQVMEASVADNALALAAYAGLVGALASPLTRGTATRWSLEGAATGLAVIAAASTGDDRTAAMVLTILGTALCVIAVTARDRSLLGWAGAAVLGMATVIRVVAEVNAPELYTLPAAALLVAMGAWRLRSDPGSSSFTVLTSGLTLALLPSLLIALDEPVSLRGALIAASGLLVLTVGVQQRLAAPFVLGAVTTGILALRHLQPVAEAVPRWISLGGVGLALLMVGVTWEARRRNLETAQRYLTALR